MVLAFPIDIRRGFKWPPLKNALAYSGIVLIMATNCFIMLAMELYVEGDYKEH